MEWRHSVSEDWLKARKGWLTATQAVGLLPSYGRYIKDGALTKKNALPFIKVMLSKHEALEPVSTGAAARGHIREPYSIEAYNRWKDTKFYHWDDALVTNIHNGLCFSPDAMDIPMTGQVVNSYESVKPNKILEVKNYSLVKHLDAYFTEECEIDERYQIAAAMAVHKKIEWGAVVFDNPNAKGFELFEKSYLRCELDDEIKLILKVAELYHLACDAYGRGADSKVYHGSASDNEVAERSEFWNTCLERNNRLLERKE